MNRLVILSLFIASLFLAGCSANHPAAAAGPAGPKTVSVTTAQAVTRTVPAAFQETGTFVADETSDIAPLVAGRVIATPVNVGDFVKRGQVVCELDHRDAQLRLDQAKRRVGSGHGRRAPVAIAHRFQRPGDVRSRP